MHTIQISMVDISQDDNCIDRDYRKSMDVNEIMQKGEVTSLDVLRFTLNSKA
jgi:hypothetical protein